MNENKFTVPEHNFNHHSLTDKQRQIYEGLLEIGEEIAKFYLDGVLINALDIASKPYLLAHLSREIESGLRQIFTPENPEPSINCNECNRPINRKVGHKKSIALSLGLGEEDEVVKKWYNVAKNFNKYAHRHGPWKSPREKEVFDHLWTEFEEILLFLVGNYFAIADRLDAILSMNKPSEAVLNTLPNLLKEHSRYVYFFRHLVFPDWLILLKKRAYFDPGNNPEPIEVGDQSGAYTVPIWPVLSYLQNVAKFNNENPRKECTDILIEIIDNILQFKKEDGTRIVNYQTDYTMFDMIRQLPIDSLKDRHFDYIRMMLRDSWLSGIQYHYRDFLDSLIASEDNRLICEGLDVLFEYYIEGDEYFQEIKSIFGENELESILQLYKDNLIHLLGKKLLLFGLFKMKSLLREKETAFSSSDIPAIENHAQTWNPGSYECQLVYLVRDCLEKLPKKDVKGIVKKLIQDKHPIFRRLALHTIDERYDEFQDMFWDIAVNPLDFSEGKHETYELLKNNVRRFSQERIQRVLEWVETADYYIHDNVKDQDVLDKHLAYCKKEWISALQPIDNQAVNLTWEQLNEVNPTLIEHPGMGSWTEFKVGNESPISIDQLSGMEVQETITYFKDFQKKPKDFFGPDVQGLIYAFKQVVKDNPDKFCEEDNLIIDAPRAIQYGWITGMCDFWQTNHAEDYDWKNIFDIIQAIFSKPDFWTPEEDHNSYRSMFALNTLSLLMNGMEKDGKAFDPKYLPQIKQILLIVWKNNAFSVHSYHQMSMTVLNSVQGKCYMALIQYSLRLARIENKETQRWDEDIKGEITEEMTQEDPLLFYVLGQFLPNLLYLDESWIDTNFKHVFPLHKLELWRSAMSGYFYNNRCCIALLIRFLKGGHLLYALNHPDVISDGISKMVCHIGIAYLDNVPEVELNSNIIQKLIASKEQSVYQSLHHFIGRSTFPDENKKAKIEELWKTIFERSITLSDEQRDKETLSSCCLWLRHFPDINPSILEMMLKSIPYASFRDLMMLCRNLPQLVDTSPEQVGFILKHMVVYHPTCPIPKNTMIKIVGVLYEHGFKELADEICLEKTKQGFYYLRPLYDQNKSS